MSILIKGMKMPTTCEECDFCHWSNLHQTGICDRCGDEPVCPDYGTDYKRTRARFCPLIGLPEKHGRLIDESTVLEMIRKSMCIKDLSFLYNAEKSVVNQIYHAPTIIEAEEDEE